MPSIKQAALDMLDAATFATDEAYLLRTLRRFVYICRCRNLKVILKKSDLFRREATWCGNVFYAEAVRFNRRTAAFHAPLEIYVDICTTSVGFQQASPVSPRGQPCQGKLSKPRTQKLAGAVRRNRFLNYFC